MKKISRKENFIRAITFNNPQWVPYCWENSYALVYPTFIERPEHEGYDSWGCYWYCSPVTGTYPSDMYIIKSVEEIVDFKAPDPYAPGLLDKAKEDIAKIDHEETFVLCSNHMGIHERCYILMGMENYLTELALNKELIAQLFEKIAEFKYRFAERMLDELDIDGIWLGEDWGTQNGLFFSPDLWRELIKPHVKRLYGMIHSKGKFVFQHSCGKIEQIIPDLVEVGMDVWNPCQPCNDLVGLKKKFGSKLTFMGGVDSEILHLHGEADVEVEVRKRIAEMASGGGFVLEPSHHVQFPEKNINCFINTAKKYGIY